MYRSNRFTRAVRRSVAAMGCALLLGGCTVWEEQMSLTPAASRSIGSVRLTRPDGSTMVLEDAAVEGDSIVGTRPQTTWRAAVAVADVKKTEVQRVDPASTFWAG